MPTGYITIQASTARNSLPISNASISAYTEINNQKTLLGFRLTNEDGKTDPISVDTPDIKLSLTPNPGSQPFSTCNIKADHPLYYTIIIKDVQIFPDITTLQKIDFVPLRENTPITSRTNVIQITPQNL